MKPMCVYIQNSKFFPLECCLSLTLEVFISEEKMLSILQESYLTESVE